MAEVTIVVKVPEEFSPRLVSAIKANDPEFKSYLAPIPMVVRDVRQCETEPTDIQNRFCLRMLENICCRFHRVAKKLLERHGSRPTLEITDEYDVQDLLNAVLLLVSDDVRPEEWTPSYAGSASRTDFLLKQERTVIEVKKTRKGLGAKELGEQLIVDIERYKAHPDCKTLVCFVYDPDGRITNPHGIENDLNRQHDGLDVRVIITPKGL